MLGEEVALAVYFSDRGDVQTLLGRLQDQKRLAKFKVPSRVFAWQGSLPRGATGKIQKREIREIVLKANSRL